MGCTLNQVEGYSKDGDYVRTVLLTGPDGMQASVMTLGARLLDLRMPDGKPLTLSFDSLQKVEEDEAYIGVVVGRVANRISNAEFQIRDVKTILEKNDGAGNHIHGGRKSWDKRLFDITKQTENSVHLFLHSPSRDQGYPSAVEVRVTYALKGEGELFISLRTENIGFEPTLTNLTVHPYFDLSGTGGKTMDSVLQCTMHAPLCLQYLELGPGNIPTGSIQAVANTPFDFRKPCTIGAAMDGGYDNYLVRRAKENESEKLEQVVSISAPPCVRGKSLHMKVFTNMPGFQFYTPTGFGKGQPFKKLGSFAIEPSGFIDAATHADFPSIILEPGMSRDQRIVYKFFTAA